MNQLLFLLNVYANIFEDNSIDIANSISELCLLVACLFSINFFIDWFVKRKVVIFVNLGASLIAILSFIFEFKYIFNIALLTILIISIIGLNLNSSEIRYIFANKFSQKKNDKGVNKNRNEVTKVFDHDAFYKTINDTTLYLSRHKIGAIMTFERKNNLENVIRDGSGRVINCPVSYDLLITIFYPGTNLHDGAVVIRGNTIVAASVFYTPSTKPLLGKYGSRHRAALGISEICDAVTIVVSEETGRISIAYNGEIESYPPDMFINAFVNIMNEEENSQINENNINSEDEKE